MALGRHRWPRVVVIGETMIVSEIEAQKDVLARSTDGGRTWSGARQTTNSRLPRAKCWHAMAADPEGHVAASVQPVSAAVKQGGGVLAAWEDSGSIAVHRLDQ